MLLMSVFYAESDKPYIVSALEEWKNVLIEVGTALAVILVIVGAIVYGLSQMQPAEMRGKWESVAMGLVIGGLVIGLLIGVSDMLVGFSQNMFKATSEVENSESTPSYTQDYNMPSTQTTS